MTAKSPLDSMSSILNGFRNMGRLYIGGVTQIRNGARYFQNAMIGTRRQIQFGDSRFK
jgi:hypothetical protein